MRRSDAERAFRMAGRLAARHRDQAGRIAVERLYAAVDGRQPAVVDLWLQVLRLLEAPPPHERLH